MVTGRTKIDMTVDTDYKSLYRKSRLNLMKYADELTDLEEKFEQLRIEFEASKQNGMSAKTVQTILERIFQE